MQKVVELMLWNPAQWDYPYSYNGQDKKIVFLTLVWQMHNLYDKGGTNKQFEVDQSKQPHRASYGEDSTTFKKCKDRIQLSLIKYPFKFVKHLDSTWYKPWWLRHPHTHKHTKKTSQS